MELVLSRAERSSVISASDTPTVVGTNLESDANKAEDGLCDLIKLKRVNILLVHRMGEPTSADTDPYLRFKSVTFCGSVHQRGIFL